MPTATARHATTPFRSRVATEREVEAAIVQHHRTELPATSIIVPLDEQEPLRSYYERTTIRSYQQEMPVTHAMPIETLSLESRMLRNEHIDRRRCALRARAYRLFQQRELAWAGAANRESSVYRKAIALADDYGVRVGAVASLWSRETHNVVTPLSARARTQIRKVARELELARAEVARLRRSADQAYLAYDRLKFNSVLRDER